MQAEYQVAADGNYLAVDCCEKMKNEEILIQLLLKNY